MKKTFDCVKMKDEAQLDRAGKLVGMSDEERMRYYERGHDELVRRQAELQSGDASKMQGPGTEDEARRLLNEIAKLRGKAVQSTS